MPQFRAYSRSASASVATCSVKWSSFSPMMPQVMLILSPVLQRLQGPAGNFRVVVADVRLREVDERLGATNLVRQFAVEFRGALRERLADVGQHGADIFLAIHGQGLDGAGLQGLERRTVVFQLSREHGLERDVGFVREFVAEVVGPEALP